MAHNLESMFYVRVAPWHGLGVCVEEALTSGDALKESGLDWNVLQRPILTDDQMLIPGYKANIRDTDNRILGVVSDKCKIVQNHEAFAFVDALLAKVCDLKPLGACTKGVRFGCWLSYQIATLLVARILSLIWCFQIPMTATAVSALR